MADALPTLLDIAKKNGSDQVAGLIDETIKFTPEVQLGYARTIKGLNYKTLVRTSLPSAGFRAANTGVDAVKSTWENRLYETYIFNPRWKCDKAVADSDEDGAAAFIALEADGVMKAAFQSLAKQFYYGTGNDVNGFAGLLAAYDSTNMVVDAGGTTESTCSSVWAVRFGPKEIAWLYGNNGALTLSDLREVEALDSNSKAFTAYVQEILARPGLQVGSKFSCARIKKLTADSGKGLTDALLAQSLTTFPAGWVPDMFLMTKRSREQLRKSRTATNPTGAPAPIPEEAFGIPIQATEALKDTETLAL